MGKIHVPHLVEKPSGFYFQPSRAMRKAGFRAEALGKEPGPAIDRIGEFNNEWEAIRNGEKLPVKPPPRAGTFAWLVRDLRRDTDEYADKKPATVDELEYVIAVLEPRFGVYQISSISPKHCKLFYTFLRQSGSVHRAAKVMKWFRYIMGYALRMGYLGANPTLAVRVKQPTGRDQLWTEAQVDAAIAGAGELGYSSMAMAVMVGYDTSLRPVDIRALRWKQFDGESFWVVQEKTGNQIRVPLYPETVEALKAHRRRDGAIQHDESHVICNLRGKPYTKDGFTHVFRDICRAAGLPDGLQFRDIRRTASSERADAGATKMELSAGTGHSARTSDRIMETYNPPSYKRAKSAQEKRRRMKESEQERNAEEQKD